MRTILLSVIAILSLAGPLAAGTWTKANVSVPRPSAMPPSHKWFPTSLTLVYDSWRRVTVGIGAHADPDLVYLAVSEYDGTAWRSRYEGSAASTPPYREIAAAAFDSWRGVTVVFGGWKGSTEISNNELWEYDGTRWTQRTWTGPGPRVSPIAHLCFDPGRGRTICLTGSLSAGTWETWEWTGSAWDRAPDLTGVSSGTTQMVFDESRGRAFVYTTDFGGNFERTREFIPGTTAANGVWQNVPISGSPFEAYIGVSLFYDSHRQRIMRHGGRAISNIYSFIDGTYTWDPVASKWTLTDFLPGEGRGAASICYDRNRAAAVLYGGTRIYLEDGVGRATTYTDTWEFSNPAPGDAWVNLFHNGTESGTPQQPWNSMPEALTHAADGGVIWVKGATAATLHTPSYRSTPVTIRAWDGPATIGP